MNTGCQTAQLRGEEDDAAFKKESAENWESWQLGRKIPSDQGWLILTEAVKQYDNLRGQLLKEDNKRVWILSGINHFSKSPRVGIIFSLAFTDVIQADSNTNNIVLEIILFVFI